MITTSQSWISFETHLVNFERCRDLQVGIIQEDYIPVKQASIQNINSVKRNDQSYDLENSFTSERYYRTESYNEMDISSAAIVFQDASFCYREDQPSCLKNLSVAFGRTDKIGIVGRTGAGKTSISLALTKVIEISSGDVLIQGKSIRDYTLEELRNEVSVVSQEPYIYEGTLRLNLDPYNKYSNTEIMTAYKNCGLAEFGNFTEGLSTEITQLGDNLSEGQKQMISIARVVLKKSRIVIVDEPTSKVDEKTEEVVTKMLNISFKDNLMITIAHRIKTIMSSDKILVLDHGKIKEYGSPSALLDNPTTIFSNIITQIKEQL